MHTPVFKKGVDMATSVDQVRIAETLDVGALAARTSSVLERLRDSARSARADERREPTFPIGKAAELVGRTTAAIREAESDGRPVAPARGENNRRSAHRLAPPHDMRGTFGPPPWRAPPDPGPVLAGQNLHGRDRQRVVAGRRGSERVHLGGARE